MMAKGYKAPYFCLNVFLDFVEPRDRREVVEETGALSLAVASSPARSGTAVPS
jgi:hypothetical protein